MEDYWGCFGFKREAFIIKVGWDFRIIEILGYFCNSLVVRMCINIFVSVL